MLKIAKTAPKQDIYCMNESTSDKAVDLSIIVACYDAEKYLPRVIQSIFQQKTKYTYEIIVIDDYSQDNSWAVLQQIQSKFPDHVRIYQSSQNCGSARAAMFEIRPKANGQYIAYIDADDLWYTDQKIEKQLNFLNQNPDYIACTHPTYVHAEPGVKAPDTKLYGHYGINEWDMEFSAKHLHNMYCHISSYIFRNIFKQDDGFYMSEPFSYTVFMGDVCLPALYFKDGGKVKWLPEVMSIYSYTGQGRWTRKTPADQKLTMMFMLLSMDLVTDKKYTPYYQVKYNAHAQEYIEQFDGDPRFAMFPNVPLEDIAKIEMKDRMMQFYSYYE